MKKEQKPQGLDKKNLRFLSRASSPNPLDIGGQAVIEGVMMKSRERLSIAVRLPDGRIKVKKQVLSPLPRILRLPFVRGMVTLVYILIIGIKALMWSANQALGEGEEEVSTWQIVGMLTFSFLAGLLFFVGVPFFAAWFTGLEGLWFNAFEGALRLGIFVGYVYAISFMKDIRRMFQYHGAEHMTVSCYEAGKELTVGQVKNYSTIHPRCGTSFIMLVLIISIILFSFIQTRFWYEQLLWRLVFVPVVAGISYEVLRLGGKFRESRVMNIIIAPGKWVQKITTRKPKDDMVEVAIAALKNVVS